MRETLYYCYTCKTAGVEAACPECEADREKIGFQFCIRKETDL